MIRTINEVYDLIKEKRDNAERDLEIAILVGDRLDMDNLVGEVDAYNDILNLIESSQLLEENKLVKGSGLEALEELRILNKFAIEHKSTFVGESLYQIIEQALKTLGNIEENLKYGYVFVGYDKDNNPLFQLADTKLYEEIKKNATH